MNNRKKIIISVFLLILLSFSGCLDFFQDIATTNITYEKHPTKIQYHISYGYQLNFEGSGSSTVNYREDLPETLFGTISNVTIQNQLNSQIKNQVENEMIFWNESFQDTQNLFLGLSADVICETMMIGNLNDSNALTIDEIKNTQPALYKKYCKSQGNNTETFIDPNNPQIKQIANSIMVTSNSNNSFQLGKELFLWLKTNTQYQYHTIDQHVQPCKETYQKKTGDCDDLSFLYMSLCRAISIPSRFIRGYLINNQNNIQEIIPHVWVEIYVGNNIGNSGWIPVECAGTGSIDAEIHQNFGLEDAHHLRLYTDDGSNESMNLYTTHITVEYGSGLTIDIQNQSDITNYKVLESKKLCIIDNTDREYC